MSIPSVHYNTIDNREFDYKKDVERRTQNTNQMRPSEMMPITEKDLNPDLAVTEVAIKTIVFVGLTAASCDIL